MIDIVGDNDLDRFMWLNNLLKDGVYQVSFTKIDGSTRTMPCTLRPDLLPPRVVTKESKEKIEPIMTETLAVFVTDINEWRSFRVMNVTEIKPL
jgi:hypothetical protein